MDKTLYNINTNSFLELLKEVTYYTDQLNSCDEGLSKAEKRQIRFLNKLITKKRY